MEQIRASLQELDGLYHTDSFAAYERKWQMVAQQLQQAFPGFTIAYAEIYTASQERVAHGGMRHVLLPKPERIDR